MVTKGLVKAKKPSALRRVYDSSRYLYGPLITVNSLIWSRKISLPRGRALLRRHSVWVPARVKVIHTIRPTNPHSSTNVFHVSTACLWISGCKLTPRKHSTRMVVVGANFGPIVRTENRLAR